MIHSAPLLCYLLVLFGFYVLIDFMVKKINHAGKSVKNSNR